MKRVIISSLIAGIALTAAATGQQQAGGGETPQVQAPTLDLVLPDAPAVEIKTLPEPPADTPRLYIQQAADPPNDPQADAIAQEMRGDGNDADNDNPALTGRAESRLDDLGYYLQVIAALCFVLFLIIVVGYIARRVGRRSPYLGGGDYGRVVGRLPLAPGASLHFIEAAGRILVIGVTKENVGLVAEYDGAEFHAAEQEEAEHQVDRTGTTGNGANFLAQLQQQSRGYHNPREDDEIATLRGDIQRLQAYLREESRESQG